MKSFKITLLTIAAALLAWPAAAGHYRETTIDYELDDSSPEALNGLRTISNWESETRAEMDQYEAEDQRWVYTFDNITAADVVNNCAPMTCTVMLVGRGGGMPTFSMPFAADVFVVAGQLIVQIEPLVQPLADAFVAGLGPTKRILEQVVLLGGTGVVGKTMPANSARAEVEYQWDGDFVRDDQVYIAKQFN